MSGSVFIIGGEETAQGLENLLQILESFGMRKQLTPRSQTISAVHHVFDDLAEHADEEEFKQAWIEGLADLQVSKLNAADAERRRRQIQQALARTSDKVMVAIVDARDLIDTGEYRDDVETASWSFTD